LDDTRNATLETLSLHPLVLSVKGFLSEEECDWIQRTAEPKMTYSGVKLMDHDKGRPASDFRTSQSAFLVSSAPEAQEIDIRTASLVRLPQSHQEYAQVLRYGNTEKYNTHHDYFEPSLYQQDARTLKLIQNGRRNRMITVFWYLTDVERGGETVFPRVDKGPPPAHGDMFDTGLKVKPERGKVIIFYSMTPDGRLDPYSLHGAAPVKEGVKWAANKWVWNAPQR
jgi:prolyl 4-hydroxylase